MFPRSLWIISSHLWSKCCTLINIFEIRLTIFLFVSHLYLKSQRHEHKWRYKRQNKWRLVCYKSIKYGLLSYHSWRMLNQVNMEYMINSLKFGVTIWCHGSWSIWIHTMVRCLTVSTHYLNQCWLIVDIFRYLSSFDKIPNWDWRLAQPHECYYVFDHSSHAK